MSAADHGAAIREARAVAHRAVTEGVNLKYVEVLRRQTYALADTADALVGLLQQAERATDFYNGAFCGLCGERYRGELPRCEHDEREMIPGSDLPLALSQSFERDAQAWEENREAVARAERAEQAAGYNLGRLHGEQERVRALEEALREIAEHTIVSEGEFPDDNCDWHCVAEIRDAALEALAAAAAPPEEVSERETSLPDTVRPSDDAGVAEAAVASGSSRSLTSPAAACTCWAVLDDGLKITQSHCPVHSPAASPPSEETQ